MTLIYSQKFSFYNCDINIDANVANVYSEGF